MVDNIKSMWKRQKGRKRQKAREKGKRYRGGKEVSSTGGGKHALPKGSDICIYSYTMIRQNHCKREVDTRLSQRTPNSDKLHSLFLENFPLHPSLQIN